MKICLIHEFSPEVDFQLRSTRDMLRKLSHGTQVVGIHGFLKEYKPGGLQVQRIINLIWIYLWVPLQILRIRPHGILVRTAPPGIQVWTSLWAGLLNIPTVAWIMDYHPEIEARMLGKYFLFKPISACLRWIDKVSLQKLKGAIVLDEAMKETLLEKAPDLPIAIHPTWDCYQFEIAENTEDRDQEKGLNLAYAGNLSMNHPLAPVEKILEKLLEREPDRVIVLHVIGTSKKGIQRFQKLATRLPIQLELHPRMSFDQLRIKLVELDTHYGIVLMEDAKAGLFSPSKFAGYLAAGIPVLYCGPPKTNAEMICTKYEAGISISANASQDSIHSAVEKLENKEELASHRRAVPNALAYFAAKNAVSFIAMFTSLLNPQAKN
jgi:hypothetical protein